MEQNGSRTAMKKHLHDILDHLDTVEKIHAQIEEKLGEDEELIEDTMLLADTRILVNNITGLIQEHKAEQVSHLPVTTLRLVRDVGMMNWRSKMKTEKTDPKYSLRTNTQSRTHVKQVTLPTTKGFQSKMFLPAKWNFLVKRRQRFMSNTWKIRRTKAVHQLAKLNQKTGLLISIIPVRLRLDL